MAKPNLTDDMPGVPLREKEGGGGSGAVSKLEFRVDRMEIDIRDMRRDIEDVKKDMVEIKTTLAEIRGMLLRIPSTQQLWAMTIGSWIAGAGIVLVAARLLT
ncbi:MAG: hypothetical protein AAFQ10_13490 [Pseudomonadota bacterium]